MTKLKSQNEVDMEEGKGSFWMATALLFIVALAIYGFVDFIISLLR